MSPQMPFPATAPKSTTTYPITVLDTVPGIPVPPCFAKDIVIWVSEILDLLFTLISHTPAATKIGNYLYVIGGRDVNDNLITAIDRYNVLNDTWELVVDWKNATSDGVAWSIERENLLMIAGGYDAIYATEGILTTYNVISGVFDTNYPKMNVGRGDTQVAHINEDEFYVIGGWTGDNFITPSDGKRSPFSLVFCPFLFIMFCL